MAVNLRGKNFLKLLDFSSQEIRYLINLSKAIGHSSQIFGWKKYCSSF